MRFNEQVCIVTGGTSGIGLATAEVFLKEGVKVVIVGHTSRKGQSALRKLQSFGNRVSFVKADVTTDSGARRSVEVAFRRHRAVDILVNNAGRYRDTPLARTSPLLWKEIIELDLTSAFLCSRHALRYMKKQRKGCIVNISSCYGFAGWPNASAYAAAKAGLIAFTKSLAVELAPLNIRVNCVCPGTIETPNLEEWLRAQADRRKATQEEVSLHPIGRLGTPEEVARAILFLASEDASFCTGTALAVDGGFSAR